MTELANDERERLLMQINKQAKRYWKFLDKVKMAEAKKLGASPHAILAAKLFPDKTIGQIKNLYYEMPSIAKFEEMDIKEIKEWVRKRWVDDDFEGTKKGSGK